MTSFIDVEGLDPSFPIAGQNNDSQGFRDNFYNIKSNLNKASEEITELQNTVIVKQDSNGDATENDLNGTILKNAVLKSAAESYYEIGPSDLTALLNDVSHDFLITFDYFKGTFQKVQLDGRVRLSFLNFPYYGCGRLTVWVTVINAQHTITLPQAVIYGTKKSMIVNNKIVFPTVGDYLLEFISVDGGETFWIVFVA